MRAFRLRTALGAGLIWFCGAVPALFAQASLPHARVGVAYSFQVTTTPAAAAGTVYGATGLPTGLSINAASGLIDGTPLSAGTTSPTLSLTSGGITNQFAVTLVVDPPVGTPTITSATAASATAGQAFTYTVTAGGSPTSFNVGSLPAGLTFTSPTISGAPARAGTYTITLSANNAAGTGATATLTLTVAPAGPVPAITSATSATATLNAAFTYQISATNTPTSFSAVGLPLGLSANAATGVISGTPTVAGTYTVALSASNANGSGATTNLTLTAGAVSAITSAGTAAFTLNQSGSFHLAASNTPLSFNVTGLPPGLAVDSGSGVISGTATSAGTFTVTVSANNATGTGPAATLTLTVSAATTGGGSSGGGGGGGTPAVTAPVFTTQPTALAVTEGGSVSLTAAAAGTAPITYQWRRNGAAIAGATSTTLTFSASLADAGVYTLAATNGGGTVVSTGATVTVAAIVVPPVITTQPASQNAAAGTDVTLAPVVSGAGLTYQWSKDGIAIPGATTATLAIPHAGARDTGHYTLVASNRAGTVTSTDTVLAVLPTNALVVNLSTRGRVGTGDGVLITGFVVSGTDPKPVLVRAVGPELTGFGVAGALADPVLELRDSHSVLVASNDNWGDAANAAAMAATGKAVGAFDLAAGSRDAAILTTLAPGLYTATVRGAGDTTGVALVEMYDASATISTSRLINVSSRGVVGTDANVLIAGFVVTGKDPKRVLIRGAGPALGAFGVSAVLADPRIELYRGNTLVATNDDWGTLPAADVIAAETATGAFQFAPGSKDAALLLTLNPGSYSVHVSGANATTGTALVEVYEVP